MKIQTFKNMKGIIHGNDPKRIGCDKPGVLTIGNTDITISGEGDDIMPLLFYGATGDYNATFVDAEGVVYTLEKVAVRGGRIAPPPPSVLELMDLRCRADMAETKCESLEREIEDLKNIFDTNSLNFLIN